MAKSDLGKLQGSPWHVGYVRMKENDSRRDKRRCLYYHSEENYCSRYGAKCHGSSHCSQYCTTLNRKKSAMNEYWEKKHFNDSKVTQSKECSHFNLSSNACTLRNSNCIGKNFCNQYSAAYVIGVEIPKETFNPRKKKPNITYEVVFSSPIHAQRKNTQPHLSVIPGNKVISKTWGIGVVQEISKTEISVQFQGKQEKVRFIFPDCFIKGHLKCL